MAALRPLLLLALMAWAVLADQESCKGRCTEGFNQNRKCQCDELCTYYQSCCSDYKTECKPQVTRGDMFVLPEDMYGNYEDYETRDNAGVHTQSPHLPAQPGSTSEQMPVFKPKGETLRPTQETLEHETVTQGSEWGSLWHETTDMGNLDSPVEELCSGKPFDAFTDLKNGSLFAFRGQYCYELDEKAVRPGYPKLIRDVWGIEGPIDAAFTRINCQGKTYLFKGSQYWRFEDGILDPDYPRNISEGFSSIPDNVDAAFALPAHSYSGRERVYFFKGKQYWEYEFQQQPSQEECEDSSLSTVFAHFAQMHQDNWKKVLEILFWGRSPGGASEPQSTSKDWSGVPSQVDAAMAGRIYIAGLSPRVGSSWIRKPKSKRRNRKRYRSHQGRSRARSQSRRRQSRSIWLSWFSSEELDLDLDTYNYDDSKLEWLVPDTCEPIQSVYFFSGDKYYRVNLRTRHVDTVNPPYPRSIAQYWLGCPAPGGK
ncbi:vitronectin [Erinaceus europaeus]|uniref:Vitronectin n=1 Tax=Erinaceus europaeus TaxID=9365 RepID=A0A1S3A810_ERIEU|nr:vitronectin [Erinaceus europaeus]